ncbi:MAG: hypothetical protein LH606_03100 [Cytophagaceae bacterium]|nr:hypothetical protein [Cytophagaceae bacterium]
MLIFHNTRSQEDSFAELSAEAIQAEIAKWNTWIGGIAAQGKFILTEGLLPSGKTVSGAEAGLLALESLADSLKTNYLHHAVKGDLLARTGQKQAAQISLERAISLTSSEVEKRLLSEKISQL